MVKRPDLEPAEPNKTHEDQIHPVTPGPKRSVQEDFWFAVSQANQASCRLLPQHEHLSLLPSLFIPPLFTTAAARNLQ